jgi:hypothetical protein
MGYDERTERGFISRYEMLEIYEDTEEARVKYITEFDGDLYITQTFHKLGLKRVLL